MSISSGQGRGPFTCTSLSISLRRARNHRIKQMTKCTFETQIEVFEGSMRYFLLVGKCLGLFPLIDITSYGRNDISTRHGVPLCPNNNATGPYYKYEQMVTNAYFIYSSLFVVVRTFFVSIIAAEVHSVSLEVAPVLYNVPSPTYCLEVHRFVEQIHGNKVALTGLKFFYVTKELVLSMVGTIVTYELVLLQFT
nr:gustatory receptor for sugar taste 64a-like [Danaus plexippus plexippus]